MRRPITLKRWLTSSQLAAWVKEAPTPTIHGRRLAVWMASLGTYPAHEIGTILGVTRDAVGRWLRNYNRVGPKRFDGPGRGGRRRARVQTLAQEKALLQRLEGAATRGHLLTVPQIRDALETTSGQRWPLRTVYDLLRRHQWRQVQPRPQHPKADPKAIRAFKKSSDA